MIGLSNDTRSRARCVPSVQTDLKKKYSSKEWRIVSESIRLIRNISEQYPFFYYICYASIVLCKTKIVLSFYRIVIVSYINVTKIWNSFTGCLAFIYTSSCQSLYFNRVSPLPYTNAIDTEWHSVNVALSLWSLAIHSFVFLTEKLLKKNSTDNL